ncbi:MAG: cytochrome C oxidase subunit IV family protein [Bdellovibrionaceae bacterium]|nr:cytochrome C oxidase subunit IV family protein [Pseudobdellovibrionaceae bacterium]
MGSHSDKHSGGGHHSHHIIPQEIYTRVMWALIVLTAFTVGFHYLFHVVMHGSVLAAPVAFLIAAIKAALVLMFFMGLKYDKPENRWIFSTGFIFLALLFVICMLDIFTRISETSTL